MEVTQAKCLESSLVHLRAPKMSDTIVVITLMVITAEALNSCEEVVGDVGWAGEASVHEGPRNILRRIYFALISITPFGVFAVWESTVQRQEAEPIISSDPLQL